jgi:hypothetical protein
VRKADGTAPTATPAGTAVSVFRAYTSLYNAERGVENTGIETTVRNFDDWTAGGTAATDDVGRDLVSNNEQWNIACYAGATADTSAVTIYGWTTGEEHYLKVYTPVLSSEVGVSQRHGGKWDEGKYRISRNAAWVQSFIVRDNDVRMEGLQIENVANNGYLFSYEGGGEIHIAYSIGRLTGTIPGSGLASFNFDSIATGGVVKMWNNILHNLCYGVYYDWGNVAQFYLHNNTIVNARYVGLNVVGNNATVYISNNLVQNTTTYEDYYLAGATVTAYTNISEDNTSPNASFRGLLASFVDGSNFDFHLSPNDTAAKDAGIMLCEDANLPFSTDIDGQSRPCSPNTWDIGADEVTQAMIEIKRNVDFGRNVNFKR